MKDYKLDLLSCYLFWNDSFYSFLYLFSQLRGSIVIVFLGSWPNKGKLHILQEWSLGSEERGPCSHLIVAAHVTNTDNISKPTSIMFPIPSHSPPCPILLFPVLVGLHHWRGFSFLQNFEDCRFNRMSN